MINNIAKVVGSPVALRFRDVSVGSTFKVSGHLNTYVKVPVCSRSIEDERNAVILTSMEGAEGCLRWLGNNTPIELVKVEVSFT